MDKEILDSLVLPTIEETLHPPLPVITSGSVSQDVTRHHHDLHDFHQILDDVKIPKELVDDQIRGNTVLLGPVSFLGESDSPSLSQSAQNQTLVTSTFASLPKDTLREVAEKSVVAFFAQNDVNKLAHKYSAHQDAVLGTKGKVVPCTIWIGKADKVTPPDRIFSIMLPDLLSQASAKKGEEIKMDVICFDVLDLLVAEQEHKKKVKTTDPKYKLIPNIAIQKSFDTDPNLFKRYDLNFEYFSEKDSALIRTHKDNFVEIQTIQDKNVFNTASAILKDILTPIYKYLFEKVEGLFTAIFGDGFLTRIGSSIWSTIKTAAGYVAEKAMSFSSVAWIVKKIWSSGVFLAKFIYNNPLLINLSIFLLNCLKMVFCVWYMGPKVGITALTDWVERQFVFKTGKTTWSALLCFVKSLISCGSTILTGDLMGCLKVGLTCAAKQLWPITETIIKAILTLSGLQFIANGVQTFFTFLLGNESDGIRLEAMGMMSLDWEVFVRALPILLPKLLTSLMALVPLPGFIVRFIQGKMQMIDKGTQLYVFWHSYIHLLWDILRTFWVCFRGSGDCCFPQSLKDSYQNAITKEEKGESTGGWGKAFGYVGRLFCDDRLKLLVMDTDLYMNGLQFKLYSLRSDFLSQLKLNKSQKVPKWIQTLSKHAPFWNKQLFFGVSAQEVEKLYPDAVMEYHFPPSSSFKYILMSELPRKLRRTILSLNNKLYQESIPVCIQCLRNPLLS